jgi:hypothetical protein
MEEKCIVRVNVYTLFLSSTYFRLSITRAAPHTKSKGEDGKKTMRVSNTLSNNS